MKKKKKSALGRPKGFTLIELLVVIAIIAILAVLIFLALERSRAAARDSQRRAFARDIATAEAMYYDTHKKYTGDVFGSEDSPTLEGDGLIAKTPDVCSGAANNCTDIESNWNTALVCVPTSTCKGFKVTAELERNDEKNFVCDNNGCSEVDK